MTIVKKVRGGAQDLLLGKGAVQQERAGGVYNVDRLDISVPVDSIEAMQALDVANYTRARVYTSVTEFVDYIYDAADGTGIAASVPEGSWFLAGNIGTEAELTAGTETTSRWWSPRTLARWIVQFFISNKDTIADLRNTEPLIDKQSVNVVGHTLPGTGGDMFWHDASDTTTPDNNGTVIRTTVGDKCWKRREKYAYPIFDFGAIPDWDGSTGTDNSVAVVSCVNAVRKTIIPKGYEFAIGENGSCFWSGLSNREITGGGKLFKTGSKGVFSFFECKDILVHEVLFDGQIVSDEANNGDIFTGNRAAADYSFAISFSRSSRCKAINNTIENFSWDGIVAQGVVDIGGATATQIKDIDFIDNKFKNVRGSMLWLKAVDGFNVLDNKAANDIAFGQKANFIFAVEWCHNGEIAGNKGYWIGDNGVGLGQMLNNVSQAVNRNIDIHDNILTVTRYHAILIAQGDNIDVYSNIITEAGKKDMPGVNSSVLTSAITIISGKDGVADEPANNRVKVHDNTIISPYEFGIYCFDRTLTTITQTKDLSIYHNTIFNAGVLTLATRLDSGGIRSQMKEVVELHDNTITNVVGDGIRVFGKASTKINKIRFCSGIGIHYPNDTIHGETTVEEVILGNIVEDCNLSGIKCFGQDYVEIHHNTVKRCGKAIPPSENGNNATTYSGIGLRSVKEADLIGNICEHNGSSGIAGYLNEVVDVTGGRYSNNGTTFTSANLRSGVYLEGDGTTPVRSVITKAKGVSGANQQYPIRILFNNNATAVDCRFGSHPSGILGAATKFTINIP